MDMVLIIRELSSNRNALIAGLVYRCLSFRGAGYFR